ncbi:MAG: Cdc6/Cdc18 family protein [Candidatus Hodarchaeota archaeon]
MTWDYFEELLKRPSIFLDESKLDINFVPEKLVSREKELSLLSQLFLPLITNPNAISRKILITGKTGVGKTATVKLFGDVLIKTAKKREIAINYVHINCRKEKTSYKVLIRIIRALNENFPKRGYSPQDLLEILMDFLNDKNLHLLIVLDEFSYLINKNGELIYSLTRIDDENLYKPQRISIIGIVRNPSCLNNLDVATLSTLQRNMIHFENYTKEQIYDILKYRAEISIEKEAFNDEIIEMISDLVSENGDIRYGLNLLWKSGKIAESKNLKCITLECVRLANQAIVPFTTLDTLQFMSSQKLIFLLAIIKSLKTKQKSEISIPEILEIYKTLCEAQGLSPRSYSKIWNFLQEFKKESIISMNIQSESIKGRKVSITIQNIDINTLNTLVNEILNSKGISFNS